MLIRDYQTDKVADILRKEHPKKVILIFWHGLGDLVLFLKPFRRLTELFPKIKFDLALQNDVGQECLVPNARLIENPNFPIDGYDFTFQIHFPMAEHLRGLWTKAEFCCKTELGIDPVSDLPSLTTHSSRLVGCHFQATALPDSCNPAPEIAQKIWQEVIDAGFIPIETLFQHKFFNPVNAKYDFISCHVRDIPAGIDKLIALLESCFANICVASGNLPVSLALMPERTLYLKKAHDIACYTRLAIPQIDVTNYQEGCVANWLTQLKKDRP